MLIFPAVLALTFLDVLPEYRNMNLIRESVFSSTEMSQLLAIMVDCSPAPTPNVPECALATGIE